MLGTDFRHAVEFSRSGRARTPAFRPSFEAVSPLYTALRSGQTRGSVRRFPRLAARSVLARCRGNSTPPMRPPAVGPRGGCRPGRGPCSQGIRARRAGSGAVLSRHPGRRPLPRARCRPPPRPASHRSRDATGSELDADPRTDGLGGLGDAVLPRALAGAAHDDQVPVAQGEPQALTTADRAEQQRPR